MALKYRLLMLMVFSASLASFAQYDLEAYWSDDTGIYHFDPDLNESDLIVSTFPKVSGGVHVTDDKLYYLSHSDLHINVADIDGGNQTFLFDVSDLDGFDFNLKIEYQEITDIVYDPDNSKGYFAAYFHAVNTFGNVSYTRSVVYSIDLNTSAIDSLFASLPHDEEDDYGYIPSIELDKTNNRLFYLVDDGGFVSSRIESRALNGSDLSIITDGFNNPTQIEIDDQSTTLFVMTGRGGGTDALYKAGLDGSDWTTLFVDNIKGDNGFVLEETEGRLYFHDNSENLLRSDLNGSGIANNVFAINSMPDAIDIANRQIYYGNTFTVLTRHTYTDDNFDSYAIDQIIREYQNLSDLQIDPVDNRLFYRLGSVGAIRSMDFDGGNDRLEYAVSSFDIKLRDWKLDPDDRRILTLEKDETPGVNTFDIYVRNLGNTSNGSLVAGDVGSANIIDIDPIGDTYVIFPSSVVGSEAVFDFKNDKAYYIIGSGGDDAIYISDSPSEQGEELSFFNVNNAQNLVLSSSEDKIYWSNKSGSVGQYRMNLDGSGEEKISDEPVVTLAFLVEVAPPELVQNFENVAFDEDAGMQVVTTEISNYFSDPNGLELSFSASSDDSEITTTIEGDELSITASSDYSGSAEITVSASNGVESVATSFQVTVNPVNDAPVFELSTSSLTLDHDFEGTEVIEITVGTVPSDEATQTVTYSLDPSSVGFATVSINSETGNISTTAIAGQSGSQEFTVTADDGQSENNTHQASFTLTVSPEEITLGTDDFDSDVRLYPNPVQSELHISVGDCSQADLKIIDASGQMILNQSNADLDKPITVSELESGVYFLHIMADDRNVIHRFIKAN